MQPPSDSTKRALADRPGSDAQPLLEELHRLLAARLKPGAEVDEARLHELGNLIAPNHFEEAMRRARRTASKEAKGLAERLRPAGDMSPRMRATLEQADAYLAGGRPQDAQGLLACAVEELESSTGPASDVALLLTAQAHVAGVKGTR